MHERDSEKDDGIPLITDIIVLQKIMFGTAITGTEIEDNWGGVFVYGSFNGSDMKN